MISHWCHSVNSQWDINLIYFRRYTLISPWHDTWHLWDIILMIGNYAMFLGKIHVQYIILYIVQLIVFCIWHLCAYIFSFNLRYLIKWACSIICLICFIYKNNIKVFIWTLSMSLIQLSSQYLVQNTHKRAIRIIYTLQTTATYLWHTVWL